ncbi:Protein transport protein YOS1 [Spathaspora sp. JA1]|nr:Protein transport protein YOS1 [Spathaspora sp. JA1]
MFGLGKLFYVVVLTINGIAVLSEERFLNRIGWGSSSRQYDQNNLQNQFNQFNPQGISTISDENSIKNKIINLINATRTLMRIPLIVLNVFIILYELILG